MFETGLRRALVGSQPRPLKSGLYQEKLGGGGLARRSILALINPMQYCPDEYQIAPRRPGDCWRFMTPAKTNHPPSQRAASANTGLVSVRALVDQCPDHVIV